MNAKFFYLLCALLLSCSMYGLNRNVKVTIKDAAKADKFNKKYGMVIPVSDFKDVLQHSFEGISRETDSAYIFISDIYNNKYDAIVSKKSGGEEAFFDKVWMMPLSYDSTGFLYKSNNTLVNYRYDSGVIKSYKVHETFPDYDLHCVIHEGDTTYYYAVPKQKMKFLFGKQTEIVDFEFFTWSERTKKSEFLFSASHIIPDSMLVPNLFRKDAQYKGLDIYHWNWMQKDGSKLLLNFALCGLMEYNLATRKVEWFWGQKGNSFSSIKGTGDVSPPYYTHCFNKITTGPYAGYYSYFEGGGTLSTMDAMMFTDTARLKSAAARIFSIDRASNTLKIEKEIIFDVYAKKDRHLPSTALGSVQVYDEYILVNTGMTIPLRNIIRIGNLYGRDSAMTFWKNWEGTYPNMHLYDLQGNEIARFTFRHGFYSYSAWLKRKKSSVIQAP